MIQNDIINIMCTEEREVIINHAYHEEESTIIEIFGTIFVEDKNGTRNFMQRMEFPEYAK